MPGPLMEPWRASREESVARIAAAETVLTAARMTAPTVVIFKLEVNIMMSYLVLFQRELLIW